MSRSRRKNPCCGWTKGGNARGEKRDKRWNHRRLRQRIRQALCHAPEGVMPTELETSNRWWMDKDGKQRFDPAEWPEGMRK